MSTVYALVDFLASPPWLFALALMLFLTTHGSRWPWTRSGGALCLAVTVVLVGGALREPSFRQSVLHPERLPVALLLLATGAVLWFEMHRSRRLDQETVQLPADDTPFERSAGSPSTTDAVVTTILILTLVVCAGLRPATLGVLADPAIRPDLAKAPWFLVGLQELTVYFDPWVAYGALPILFVAGLLGLPFLQIGAARQRTARALFLFGWLFLWLWPMAVGALLRGPDWRFFGPFEPWTTPRLEIPEATTLARVFWIHGLKTVEPTRWWIRELPGLLLIIGYFGLLPVLLARWRLTRDLFASYRDSLGTWRFTCATAWVLTVLLVPLKMYGRWLWGIGYWIHFPEWSLSF